MKVFGHAYPTTASLDSDGDIEIEQIDTDRTSYTVIIPIEHLPLFIKTLRLLAKEASHGG